MSKRRCQEVLSRNQLTLFPPRLGDHASENNTVRTIGAFVVTLDLWALGFEHAEASCGAGQLVFDAALPLKLYYYGLFSERGLDEWKTKPHELSNPTVGRRFDHKDAVIILGFGDTSISTVCGVRAGLKLSCGAIWK